MEHKYRSKADPLIWIIKNELGFFKVEAGVMYKWSDVNASKDERWKVYMKKSMLAINRTTETVSRILEFKGNIVKMETLDGKARREMSFKEFKDNYVKIDEAVVMSEFEYENREDYIPFLKDIESEVEVEEAVKKPKKKKKKVATKPLREKEVVKPLPPKKKKKKLVFK